MSLTRVKKRVEAGDAVAMTMMGQCHILGEHCAQINFAKGIELWQKAAKLGDVEAHFQLACSYHTGDYGLKRDVEKALFHCEVAAMGGVGEPADWNRVCLRGIVNTLSLVIPN